MAYFKNFPLIKYRFGDEVDPVIITRLSTYAGAIDELKNNVAVYQELEIADFERPDTLSFRLYGNSEYYWTFFMMNDELREGGWPMTQQRIYEYAEELYPNYAIQLDGFFTDETNTISGAVKTVSLTTPGSGYTDGATDVATTGGTGTGLTVNTSGIGGLTGVTINQEGRGYTAGDIVTVSGGSGGTITVDSVGRAIGADSCQVALSFVEGQKLTLNDSSRGTVVRKEPDLAQVIFSFDSGNANPRAITKIEVLDTANDSDVVGRYSADDNTNFYNNVYEYLAPRYYTSGGERIDIDTFDLSNLSGNPVTYREHLVDENDRRRTIRVIKKEDIDAVVSNFQRVIRR
jgi:hypothetical protein